VSFSADWLALRAPFDSAARAVALEERLADWARGRGSLRVVDLGAGSGNNLAHLHDRLPVAQSWTLVDGDADLLSAAARRHPAATVRQADLTGDLADLIPEGTDLVTASALIDLVSREWLTGLADRVRAIGCAVLVVLTYDGRIGWRDETDADSMVRALVNRHQRGDKGFGPALGPEAPDALSTLLPDVTTVASDWRIAAGDGDMRAALVDGWAAAARETAPDRAAEGDAWQRTARAPPGSLFVGHADQLWLADR